MHKKSVLRRLNGWRIGLYDAITIEGMICVGQLGQIDANGYGRFYGYCLNDMMGQGRDGQEMEWGHYLSVNEPNRKISPRYIQDFEDLLEKLNDGHKKAEKKRSK